MEKFKHTLKVEKNLILMLLGYSVIFIFTTYFFYLKIAAFGCFDDCFNIMGGYFLLNGEQIFSDFFFNHAPFMAPLSYGIQRITNPDSIYSLLLYHRLSLYIYSFLFGVLLIYRFRLTAFLFLLTYELTKFYIFGDRFLAESYIVYPLIYALGIVLMKLNSNKIKNYDYFLIAIFTWFVIFMREPYIPLALFLFIILLLGKPDKTKALSVIIFGSLSLLTLIILPFKDLINNVFIYNSDFTSNEINQRGGILKNTFISFLYPIYVFIEGRQSIFRLLISSISLIFLISYIKLFFERRFKLAFIILLILGIANIRFTEPGIMYYQAFHMLIWYSFLIFTTYFLITTLNIKKVQKTILVAPIIFILIYSMFSTESYLRQNFNRNDEFTIGYNLYFTYGTVIKNLSNENDTIFLEERDDLIYWVAKLPHSYKYQWYTSFMPNVSKYSNERKDMLIRNSPVFYYDACLQLDPKNRAFITEIANNYTRLNHFNKPSCLLVKNEKFKKINKSQWDSISSFGFSPPIP